MVGLRRRREGCDENSLLHVFWRVMETYLALSKLVVVVREHEVYTSRVDIQLATQDFSCHDTAFDVPPRPT